MYRKKKKEKKQKIKASSRIHVRIPRETEEKFSLILACSTEKKFRVYQIQIGGKRELVAQLLYGISVRKISLPLTDTAHRGSSADVLPTNNTGANVKRPLLLHFESRAAIVKFVSSRRGSPRLPNN